MPRRAGNYAGWGIGWIDLICRLGYLLVNREELYVCVIAG